MDPRSVIPADGSTSWLPGRTILLVKGGSHAYGTALPTSDLDWRGIAVAPERYSFGFIDSFSQRESKHDPDLVIHEIRSFLRHAANGDPNVVEVLFGEEEDRVLMTPWAQRLLDARHLLVSRRLRHSFAGFAVSQLLRLENREPGNMKLACHAVRLIRMAHEILATGEIRVRRPDAADLLGIRRGEWSVAEVGVYVRSMDAALDEVEADSVLPREPDRRALEDLCIGIVREYLRENG